MDHLNSQDQVPVQGGLAAQHVGKATIASPYLWIVVACVNLLFVAWIYSSVHVKHDYEAFYSAGRAFLTNPHNVFDPAVQLKAGGIWKHPSELLPFYHLPNELIIFAPLSLFSYGRSLLVWRFLAIVALLSASRILSKVLVLPARMTALVFVTFVPAVLCIGEGQDSTLLLLILAGTYALLHSEKQELAGVLLAFGIFKPQIVCIVALAVLLSRRTRFFLAFVISVVAMFGALTIYLGPTWVGDLLRLIRAQEVTQSATIMVSIRGLVSLLTHSNTNAITLVLSALLVFAAIGVWNKSRNVEITLGSAVLVGGLVAFHFHIYDATILLLPISILYKRGMSEWDSYALVVFFVSPILVFLMANDFTGATTVSLIVFLGSYWAYFREDIAGSAT